MILFFHMPVTLNQSQDHLEVSKCRVKSVIKSSLNQISLQTTECACVCVCVGGGGGGGTENAISLSSLNLIHMLCQAVQLHYLFQHHKHPDQCKCARTQVLLSAKIVVSSYGQGHCKWCKTVEGNGAFMHRRI